MKLGKLEARPDAVSFKFTDYVKMSELAPPPPNFGQEKLIRRWGMGGNDLVGDCVFAGAQHEIMLWCAEAGKHVEVKDGPLGTAVRNYAAATGYDPRQTDDAGNNPTDQGTDVADWLERRRRTGFIDEDGLAHKVGAYVKLELGNINQLRYAAYYFDGLGIGVNFPSQWMDTFRQGGRTWTEVRNPDYQGGHYISCVAFRDSMPVVVSWGQVVRLTPSGYRQMADEVYAYLSPDKIRNGVDINGISYGKLASDINQLRSVD